MERGDDEDAGRAGRRDQFAGLNTVSLPSDSAQPMLEEPPTDIQPTELAMADALVAAVRQAGGRAIHTGDGFRCWNGDCFPKDADSGPVQEMAKAMVRQGGPSWKPSDHQRMARRASISGILGLSASALAVARSDLDMHDYLLPCLGGVTVELETGRIRPSSSADLMTRRAGVAPDFSMPTPIFFDFVMQVAGGDEDYLRFFQVLFGYCLTGSTKEQRLFYIVGRGGTGKSTFTDILRYILGDFAVVTEAATFAEQRYDPHPAALAALDAARVVIANEFEGRRIDASKVKAFTGDGVLSVRGMRENFRQSIVRAKLIMVGNSEPQLRMVDEAIRRRFVLIPFNSPPARPDSDLLAKLRAEAPGIVAWAILGAREWIENGLYLPAAIIKASSEYLDEQDSFGTWVEEHLDLTNRAAFTTSSDLFANWKLYAEGANEAAGTAKAFGSRLRKLGLQSVWKRVGGKGAKAWEGCQLRGGTP